MAAPLFNRLSPQYKQAYDQFFKLTAPGQSINLTHVTELADKVDHVLRHGNPIWDTWNNQWGDQNRSREAYQWHLNQLSFVKQRLSAAIVHKREYYENTWMGKITKFVLRLFCLWNNGNTYSIRKAEDFLLRYDTRYPIYKHSGTYKSAFFLPLLSAEWIREHLDIRNFYNYNPPSRAIEVKNGNNDRMPRFMVAVN